MGSRMSACGRSRYTITMRLGAVLPILTLGMCVWG